MHFPKAPLFAAAALIALAGPAFAHRQWMVPSTTVVSGTDDWVTVDAAISNDLFFPDHQPMRTEQIKVWQPDGSPAQIENAATGKYRSTFDVHLTRVGTWKIGTAQTSVTGGFTRAGEEWRVGGRGMRQGAAPADARPRVVATVADIPADATDVRLTEVVNRNEIFVTAGAPTTTVFQPTGSGLEMVPVTHPTELVQNEPARFRFLVDGKPAAGLKVTLIPGGKRYRDGEGAWEVTTGADGVAQVRWPGAGMVWMNATLTDQHPSAPRATERRMSYVSTLEVLAP